MQKKKKTVKESHKKMNNEDTLQSPKKFSRVQLIAFCLLFAVIGGYFIYRSFAAAPLVASLEAEQMNLPTGGSVVADTSASSGKAVRLTSNGTATGTVSFPSPVTSLTVIAKGVQCNGAPTMNVSLDGANLLNAAAVSATGWAAYSATPANAIAAGSHTLAISFTNDNSYSKRHGHTTTTCSRDLYADVTNFFGPAPPPTPAPTVTFSASPSSLTAGQAATLTWNSSNATNCSASGAWSGSQPTSGTASTGALNQNSTYTLTCAGAGGGASSSATVSAASSGTVVWNGDFETGNLSQYTDSTQCMPGQSTVISGAAASGTNGPSAPLQGKYYWQSLTKSGDNILGGERCEIIKSGANISNGADQYYGWSVFMPTNLPANGLIGQFHGTYDYNQANIQWFIDHGQIGAFGASSTSPRWEVGINGGTTNTTTCPSGQYVSSTCSKAFDLGLLSSWEGQWVNVITHVKWQDTSTGTVEIWMKKASDTNYTKIVSQVGDISNLWQGYTAYLKLGINRTQNSGLPNAYLWYDNVKQGTTYDSVAQ